MENGESVQAREPLSMREPFLTRESFLAQHPYFRGLKAEQLTQIARRATVRHLATGEILALEGDPCQAVYLVMRGRVRAYKLSPQGREQVINELCSGDLLYLVPALDGGSLPVTTRASAKSTLLAFPCSDFVRTLREYPSIAVEVLGDFAARLRALTSLVEDLSLRTVPQRLAKLLVERVQAPDQRRLTQREMAAQLGTVREVVARSLADFDQRGWINLQRGVIEITDLEALTEFAISCGAM